MAIAALAVVSPAIVYGYPTGHDSFLHTTGWYDVLSHWQEGNFFPAWGARFAMGWGQPIHILYPPLSLNLGALCLLLFGPYFAPIMFGWMVLTASGYSAYRFSKLLLPANVSVVAGLIYLLSPYLALDLYERNAFAESLAAALFPFVLYAYVRVQRDKASPIFLAFALCLVLLTNIPAMAVTASVIAVLAIADSVGQRSAAPVLRLVSAAALTTALGAFYLIPVGTQRTLVMSRLVATGGQSPERNFELLSGVPLFRHDFFSYLALISATLTVLLIVAISASWPWKTAPLKVSWIVIAAFAVVMMLPISTVIYGRVAAFHYVTFPWRYLFVVSLLVGLFAAQTFHRSRRGMWLLVLVGCGFAAGWFAMWPPTFLHDPYASWGKYSDGRTRELPGVQEIMPITARYDEDGRYGEPQLAAVESGGPCQTLKVVAWKSEYRLLNFECPQPTTLVIKTFFYPGWRIVANGRPVPVAFNEHGAFLVQVRGSGNLEMQFVWTPDRILGAAISLVALVLCVGIAWFQRRRAGSRLTQTSRA